MEKKLSEFKIKEEGVVLKVAAEGKVRSRIFDMGITPGAKITLKKCAPLGDPIEVRVRGYELSLRKSEAALIAMTLAK